VFVFGSTLSLCEIFFASCSVKRMTEKYCMLLQHETDVSETMELMLPVDDF